MSTTARFLDIVSLFGKNARRAVLSSITLLSIAICILALLMALFPGFLAPQDPFAQNLGQRLSPPSLLTGEGSFLLGSDHLGRDVFSRIIFGARATLIVGAAAVVLAGLLGTAAGVMAGYLGGWIDIVISRLIDMQLSFPVILLIMAIVAVVGPSMTTLIVVLGITSWPQFARIVRSQAILIREMQYVEASVAMGMGTSRIVFRHVLPNISSTIVVYATYEFSRMILMESMVSYLGLGIPASIPTWGVMISEGQRYLAQAWAPSIVPGLAIISVIFATNMLGDFVRDHLDPQLAK